MYPLFIHFRPVLCFILMYNCGLTVRNKRICYVVMLYIRGTSHGPVSVSLSVTSQCSIETAERIELVFDICLQK